VAAERTVALWMSQAHDPEAPSPPPGGAATAAAAGLSRRHVSGPKARGGGPGAGDGAGEGPTRSARAVSGGGAGALVSSHSAAAAPARPEDQRLQQRTKWVLYPGSRAMHVWDGLMLLNLLQLSVVLPVQIGVAANYLVAVSLGWAIFEIVTNAIFFVDTWLVFFRAYYNEHGQLVFDQRTIALAYLRSSFVPNLLAVMPTTLPFVILTRVYPPTFVVDPTGADAHALYAWVMVIKVLDLLKFLRFRRVSRILEDSEVVAHVRNSVNSQVLSLWYFLVLIFFTSHWMACSWCFVAFLETNSFGLNLYRTPNWIGNWYNMSYNSNFTDARVPPRPGGLNPIGWDRYFDRYVLSWMFAAQTLTSVGYGNILPYTAAEWWVACVLVLLSGLMWAFLIGSTVAIAAALMSETQEYRERLDDANALIRRLGDGAAGKAASPEDAELARHIREFLKLKRLRAAFVPPPSSDSAIAECYPVLASLPAQMRLRACLRLCGGAFHSVPYLRALEHDAQLSCAASCRVMAFAAGVRLDIMGADPLTRGIYYVATGAAVLRRRSGHKGPRRLMHAYVKGMSLGRFACLSSVPSDDVTITFLTFSEVIFVPQRAVLDALARSPDAWRSSARWNLLGEALLRKAREPGGLFGPGGDTSGDARGVASGDAAPLRTPPVLPLDAQHLRP
jgi:hypothetical protein